MYIIRFLIVLMSLILANSTVVAQELLDWTSLSDVKFEKAYSDSLGLEYDLANFGKTIQSFDGKKVKITGYIIPLDPMGINFVLSRNPNATCFFCGGAGPETIVDIKLKPRNIRRYKMDERITFQGIFQIHPDNASEFIYTLTEAEPL